MRAYYSVKSLVGLELSCLPKTERGLQLKADREQWPYTWEKVQGGGRKRYLAHLLPKYVRQAILKKEEIDSLVPANQRQRIVKTIMPDQQPKAMAKADLLRLYMQAKAAAPWGKKTEARDEFMVAYNSGIAYPQLFETLGEQNYKTLEGWERKVKKAGGDTMVLADNRGYHKRGKSALTPTQTDILLRCALHPNRPRVSEAIRMAHAIMNTKGIENGSSDATYRRWLNEWASRNHHIWTFHREGAKAWNDKCAYYIERDYSLINVGDILVADGHVLNFEILNPWSGRPKRMSLILFLDMKSGMPMGWEIMPTENTQTIASALRRSIIRLGMVPKVVYLDNGRAFRAKHFQGCQSFDEAGFAGLYERLGIKTIFAWPYHGQSKTVERFFGSFAELERWCPTYSGTSIERKPPRMMRGERLHRKVHENAMAGRFLTLEQAHRAIAAWFDEYASRRQRGHLDGATPMEVFLEGRGPGVDKAELTYLMMSLEVKHIHRNGISFQKQNYYHPALYGRRHPVVVRYDQQDLSSIFVYDQDGSYLCEAAPVEKIHPAANLLGRDEDKEKLVRNIEHKKQLEKEASAMARNLLETEILPQHEKQMIDLGVVDEAGGPPIKQLPEKPKQITKADEEQIMAEVAELEAASAEVVPIAEDDYQPTVVDEASMMRQQLESLGDVDRYDMLIEMEAQGQLIPKQWQAWMRYFELSPEYERHKEYFEEARAKAAMMYQAAEEM